LTFGLDFVYDVWAVVWTFAVIVWTLVWAVAVIVWTTVVVYLLIGKNCTGAVPVLYVVDANFFRGRI
jgi:hypothetical protein